MTLFFGIDWAETHHDVAIVDDGDQLVAKKRILDDPVGFAQLVEMLTAAGDCAESPVPVAIETPRSLLVAALKATGRPVYAINPLAVAHRRVSVARRGCPGSPEQMAAAVSPALVSVAAHRPCSAR